VRHLIDVFRTWDYLPLGLRRRREPLLLYCARTRHPALATSPIRESNDDASLLPSGSLSSKGFSNEANATLSDGRPMMELPDIQGPGILALYQLRYGLEAEACELAEALRRNACALLDGETLEDYSKAQKITDCGTVPLTRYDAKQHRLPCEPAI
jgi:hypothetical protein